MGKMRLRESQDNHVRSFGIVAAFNRNGTLGERRPLGICDTLRSGSARGAESVGSRNIERFITWPLWL